MLIFARPRHPYATYADVYRLIELAGYPLVYIDEIDAMRADATYVLTILNGEWHPRGWPGARARIVLYDLEWHMDGVGDVPGLAEVWGADAWYAARIGARYVPLGSDARLAGAGTRFDSPRYDVAMLAYLTGRRRWVRDRLQEGGLRLAPDGHGAERDAALRASALMLHVHQMEGVPTVAPQRFALAAAYGLPLLSERVADAGIFKDGPVWFAPLGRLPDVARHMLKAPDVLRTHAEGLHELLCARYTFRRCIEEAL